MVVGAITGVLIAVRPPRSRDRTRDEIVTRAREAAETAGEWIPVSLNASNGNGGTTADVEVSELESEA